MQDFTSKEWLPMFPLAMVAYPLVTLNLHIFEERYRQLIKDCHVHDLTFGIPTVIDGNLQNIGTEIKLKSIEKVYDDGRMDVSTYGLRTFEILDFETKHEPHLYGAAKVKYTDLDIDGDHDLYDTLVEQLTVLYDLFKLNKSLPENDGSLYVYQFANQCGLNLSQELELLSFNKEIDRQLFVIEHLNDFIPKAIEMEERRKKIQMNGHFRNVIPPDLKTIT